MFSFLLVFVTLYMRANFEELPVYAEIKAKGETSKNPWREAFLNPANLKYVVIATIVVLGEGVVWYSSQFWALYFLQTVAKVDTLTTAYIVGAGLIIGTPTLILFGWLSDIIGRKPVILGGFFLAAVTYYPLYAWLGSVTQPGNINMPVAILIIAILVAYVGMVYGPIGAFLAEFFPGRIRYTAVSMPYMIGNGWGGGLVPFITTAMYTATGSVGLCTDLSDRCSGDMLCAQPVLDAGDAQDENLGAAGGISVIAKLGKISRVRGPFGPALFLAPRQPRGLSARPRSRQLMLPRNSTSQSVRFKRISAAMSLHWRLLRGLFVRECHVLPSGHYRGLGRIVRHRHGVGRHGRLRRLWVGWSRSLRLSACAALRFRRLRRLRLACGDLCAAGRLCAPALPAPPIAPAPIAVDHWDTGGWGGCGCGSCGCAGAALYARPVAPAPIYVVNQGPEYTGPGIMVTYRTYSPQAGLAAPYDYPYISRPGYGYGYGYG